MHQGIEDDRNRKGLISDDGQRKAAFDALREFYEEVAEKGSL